MWCNRFRPTDFSQLLNAHTTPVLSNLASESNPPHLLLVGPPGSGRHVRAYLYLQKLFKHEGALVFSSSTVQYEHNGQSYELPVLSTHFSLEINPSLAAHDASVVSSVIKSAAYTAAVNGAFKVLLLQDADCMSFLAQQALRRLMEEHQRTCKLVFFATGVSGLIPAIRSRCFALHFRAFNPNEQAEILDGLERTFAFEIKSKDEIIATSRGNLRRLYLQAQALYVSYQRGQQHTVKVKWEQLSEQLMASYVFSQHNIDAQFRAALVEILKLAVPPEVFLLFCFDYIERRSGNAKFKAFNALMASEYACRLQYSQISLVHIEAYLLNVISAMQSCK